MKHVSEFKVTERHWELSDLHLFHWSSFSVIRKMAEQPPHLRATYNEVHKLIGESAKRIAEFKPDMFIAIGHSEFPPPSIDAMSWLNALQAEG
jgi:hypothetical protein